MGTGFRIGIGTDNDKRMEKGQGDANASARKTCYDYFIKPNVS